MAMRFTEHPQQAVIRRQTARNLIPRANLTSITADGLLVVKTLGASKTLTKFLQAGKPRRKFFVSILEAPTERI
jgi:translation initiation factor 2B subunit (eIF-2B alpha/beta/delta family)